MRFPLVFMALAFCGGIVFGGIRDLPFAAFIIFWAGLSLVFFLKKISSGLLMVLFSFFLGALLISNSRCLGPENICRIIPQNVEIVLTGKVDSEPQRQINKINFILKVEQVSAGPKWLRASGRLMARSFIVPALGYGDRVLLKGAILEPRSFSPGFNYAAYLKQQGIQALFNVGLKQGQVKILERGAGNRIKFFSIRLKEKLSAAIHAKLSALSAGVLSALILGERQELPAYLVDILMKLGTIHIIAISGFNVGIVALIVLLILKIAKIPRKFRYVLAVLLLSIYCILTGSSAPVVRATLMAAILLAAYFFQRPARIYNCLAASAIVILAFNPWQIFSVSFQLSYLSVIFITWLSPQVKSFFPGSWDKRPWINYLVLTFSTSFAAWIGLLPLIAYYFKIISPAAILANMIIVPFAALITLTGFSLALAGALVPQAAVYFAPPNEILVGLLFKTHFLFLGLPGAYYRIPSVPLIFIPLYYLLLAVILTFLKYRRSLQGNFPEQD